ncbi:unnamed protein product, partial [Prorocentrum cordatum]
MGNDAGKFVSLGKPLQLFIFVEFSGSCRCFSSEVCEPDSILERPRGSGRQDVLGPQGEDSDLTPATDGDYCTTGLDCGGRGATDESSQAARRSAADCGTACGSYKAGCSSGSADFGRVGLTAIVLSNETSHLSLFRILPTRRRSAQMRLRSHVQSGVLAPAGDDGTEDLLLLTSDGRSSWFREGKSDHPGCCQRGPWPTGPPGSPGRSPRAREPPPREARRASGALVLWRAQGWGHPGPGAPVRQPPSRVPLRSMGPIFGSTSAGDSRPCALGARAGAGGGRLVAVGLENGTVGVWREAAGAPAPGAGADGPRAGWALLAAVAGPPGSSGAALATWPSARTARYPSAALECWGAPPSSSPGAPGTAAMLLWRVQRRGRSQLVAVSASASGVAGVGADGLVRFWALTPGGATPAAADRAPSWEA